MAELMSVEDLEAKSIFPFNYFSLFKEKYELVLS